MWVVESDRPGFESQFFHLLKFTLYANSDAFLVAAWRTVLKRRQGRSQVNQTRRAMIDEGCLYQLEGRGIYSMGTITLMA